MYEIIFLPQAEKKFLKLEKKIRRSIFEKLNVIVRNPLVSGKLKSYRKIIGTKNAYRVRIDRYRVIYLVLTKDKKIGVLDIFKRGEVDYQKVLERLKSRGVLE